MFDVLFWILFIVVVLICLAIPISFVSGLWYFLINYFRKK